MGFKRGAGSNPNMFIFFEVFSIKEIFLFTSKFTKTRRDTILLQIQIKLQN